MFVTSVTDPEQAKVTIKDDKLNLIVYSVGPKPKALFMLQAALKPEAPEQTSKSKSPVKASRKPLARFQYADCLAVNVLL